ARRPLGRRRRPPRAPGRPDAGRRRGRRGQRRLGRRPDVGSLRRGTHRAAPSGGERVRLPRGEHSGQPAERPGSTVRPGRCSQARVRPVLRSVRRMDEERVMVALTPEQLTADAFAPYGRVVERPFRSPDADGPGWRWWAETALLPGDGRPWGVGYLELEPTAPQFDW